MHRLPWLRWHCYGTAGVSKAFMSPYNFKVWGHPPVELNTEWMGERVATIDFKRILRNMVQEAELATASRSRS